MNKLFVFRALAGYGAYGAGAVAASEAEAFTMLKSEEDLADAEDYTLVYSFESKDEAGVKFIEGYSE